jgi:hypothetical protein
MPVPGQLPCCRGSSGMSIPVSPPPPMNCPSSLMLWCARMGRCGAGRGPSPVAAQQRGHGALYDLVNHSRADIARLCRAGRAAVTASRGRAADAGRGCQRGSPESVDTLIGLTLPWSASSQLPCNCLSAGSVQVEPRSALDTAEQRLILDGARSGTLFRPPSRPGGLFCSSPGTSSPSAEWRQ